MTLEERSPRDRRVPPIALESPHVEPTARPSTKLAGHGDANGAAAALDADGALVRFLDSLGLAKYRAALLAEEVDLDGLLSLGAFGGPQLDADLAALSIPLGPHRKIAVACLPSIATRLPAITAGSGDDGDDNSAPPPELPPPSVRGAATTVSVSETPDLADAGPPPPSLVVSGRFVQTASRRSSPVMSYDEAAASKPALPPLWDEPEPHVAAARACAMFRFAAAPSRLAHEDADHNAAGGGRADERDGGGGGSGGGDSGGGDPPLRNDVRAELAKLAALRETGEPERAARQLVRLLEWYDRRAANAIAGGDAAKVVRLHDERRLVEALDEGQARALFDAVLRDDVRAEVETLAQ